MIINSKNNRREREKGEGLCERKREERERAYYCHYYKNVKDYIVSNEVGGEIKLEYFSLESSYIHLMKFVKLVVDVNYSNIRWELTLRKIGVFLWQLGAWVEIHSGKLGNFEEFMKAFMDKY